MMTQAAMEWLFEHESDSTIDDPLSSEELRDIARAQRNFAPDPVVCLVFLVEYAAIAKIERYGIHE